MVFSWRALSLKLEQPMLTALMDKESKGGARPGSTSACFITINHRYITTK